MLSFLWLTGQLKHCMGLKQDETPVPSDPRPMHSRLAENLPSMSSSSSCARAGHYCRELPKGEALKLMSRGISGEHPFVKATEDTL
jgi:hypothetical protein